MFNRINRQLPYSLYILDCPHLDNVIFFRAKSFELAFFEKILDLDEFPNIAIAIVSEAFLDFAPKQQTLGQDADSFDCVSFESKRETHFHFFSGQNASLSLFPRQNAGAGQEQPGPKPWSPTWKSCQCLS